MSRFNVSESEFYGAQKNNYFSLKDDGDTATVRFLYNDINDIEGVAVHEVEIGDRKIDVECLRNYNDPVDNCPLCAAGYRQNAKLFIKVYDEGSKESKIWTRGRTFFNKLSSLCARYNPLVGTPFEVERVGKKGDKSTTYETYPKQSDNARVEDFPEINPEGICFQQKTAEELDYYLRTGSFPEQDEQVARGTRQSGNTREVERRAQRETPAAPIRRRPTYSEEDNF